MVRAINIPMKPYEKVAMILAIGAVALVLIIAIGSFGRSFYLAVATNQDHPISDSATQLLTALGSSLVGAATGYIGGSNSAKRDKD